MRIVVDRSALTPASAEAHQGDAQAVQQQQKKAYYHWTTPCTSGYFDLASLVRNLQDESRRMESVELTTHKHHDQREPD